MSSKTAPAYVITEDLTEEQRRNIVETLSEPGHETGDLVVQEDSGGNLILLVDGREKRTLYHYTSSRQWERIQQDGYLRVNPHGFVALTDEPNLRPASLNAHWATAGPLDKTQVRITVISHETDPFADYCRDNNVDPEWVARQTRVDSAEHWFVLDRPIPSNEWIEVRMGDTPIGKRPLPRRKRSNERPLWQTSFGTGSRCDFCGYDEEIACYRYECRPFELDGWFNGDPNADPSEADWAACWNCAALIQQRNVPALLARGDSQMTGVPVTSGGKHGTPSGVYDKNISHARVRAFFQHYTKRRWFVGKCDFCSIRGEGVRWQYECGRFTSTHPMTGEPITNDSPWCLCEWCSKLVDAKKQKALVERALEHQFGLLERDLGMEIIPQYRARCRLAMTEWVALFFKHKRSARHAIADLPPRTEIPQASIPAQQALNEQMTLLRWLEGSEGRRHLGGWNDRYEDKPKWTWDQRDADGAELSVWTQPLRYGEAFYWEPRTADAIRQAASELAENPDVPFFMRPQILPAPYGFFYSNEPLGTSAGAPCRAIGWAIFTNARPMRQKEIKGEGNMTEMEVIMWPRGDGDPSQAEGIILTFWSERPQDKVLRPSGQLLWSFGVDFRHVAAFRRGDEAVAITKESSSYEQTTMTAALFQFIQQRIVVAGHGQPVSKAIRKRIDREYPEHHQTVRVVTLRRTQRADYHKPDEPTGRSLSYQFKVHGFWRNQCFNTAGHADAERSGVGCNDHMTIYVHDFFKGPADAPELPEAQRVYDVAR